jgi:aspartate-semialdehyde dehydrogenase
MHAGKVISTPYGDVVVEEFTVERARNNNFVFLAVSGEFALQYAKEIAEGDGPYVIDNSSAFRYMPGIFTTLLAYVYCNHSVIFIHLYKIFH